MRNMSLPTTRLLTVSLSSVYMHDIKLVTSAQCHTSTS